MVNLICEWPQRLSTLAKTFRYSKTRLLKIFVCNFLYHFRKCASIFPKLETRQKAARKLYFPPMFTILGQILWYEIAKNIKISKNDKNLPRLFQVRKLYQLSDSRKPTCLNSVPDQRYYILPENRQIYSSGKSCNQKR